MSGAISAVLGGVGTMVASLFGGGNDTPAPPSPTAPTVMPTPDDQAVQAAKKRSIAAQVARRGRASTILSDTGAEKLGS